MPTKEQNKKYQQAYRQRYKLYKNNYTFIENLKQIFKPDDQYKDLYNNLLNKYNNLKKNYKTFKQEYNLLINKYNTLKLKKSQIKEVIVEKPIEIIKEVPKEIIKEVIKEVPIEIIKEVPKEIIKEVIKEVPIEIIKEVIKEVPIENIQLIKEKENLLKLNKELIVKIQNKEIISDNKLIKINIFTEKENFTQKSVNVEYSIFFKESVFLYNLLNHIFNKDQDNKLILKYLEIVPELNKNFMNNKMVLFNLNSIYNFYYINKNNNNNNTKKPFSFY